MPRAKKPPVLPEMTRREKIYDALLGLSRGRASLLLCDTLLEIIREDPAINTKNAQVWTHEVTRLAENLAYPDLLYLLISGIHFQIENRLFHDTATGKEGTPPSKPVL